MDNQKITIIGGGNLGSAIAEGLLVNGSTAPANLTVTRRKMEHLNSLKEKGVNITNDNIAASKHADIIIVAVKPLKLIEVLHEIKPTLNNQILISVVTGIGIKDISDEVGKNVTVFRVMPNTAIAIRQSMTCVATKNGTEEQKLLVKSIFDKLGLAILIDEELIAASTVLGACGIAYSLRYIRAASQGGIQIGFDAATAQLIAAQTVKGAASLLLERGEHPEREIDRVTTPQGCTIAGINEMEHQGFSSSLIKGIMTSYYSIEKMV